MPNCNFDQGTSGWQHFTQAGGAAFSVLQGGGECHAPACPAGYLVVDDHFVGGIYQQVSATPGQTYQANIVWLVFDSLINDNSIRSQVGGIGRKVGIDPFGGTDPSSSNIIWGPDSWQNDCKICDYYEVKATAQAETITVFLRIDDQWKVRGREKGLPVPGSRDQFWIDDFGLRQIDGEGVIVQSAPTDTPTPEPAPTDTPLPAPTATAEPADLEATEAEPTATPQPADTETEEIPVEPEPTETPVESKRGDLAEDEPAEADLEAASVETNNPTPTAPDDASPATELAEIPTIIAPPPTITPTSTPTPTNTPEKLLAENNLPESGPSNNAAPPPVTAPANWLTVAGTAACGGGIMLMMVALFVTGLVWLYRLGWGEPDRSQTTTPRSQTEFGNEIGPARAEDFRYNEEWRP